MPAMTRYSMTYEDPMPAAALLRCRRLTFATLGVCALGATAFGWLAGWPSKAQGCGPELLRRVRLVRLVTPFESTALAEGLAEYRPTVQFSPGEPAKVHVRTERRYLGPLLDAAQLNCFLQHGMADAFHPVLKPPLEQGVTAMLRPIEAELGNLAREIDLEIERAKAERREAKDVILVRSDAPGRVQQEKAVRDRMNKADPQKERWFVESHPEGAHFFRITKEQSAALFDLERGQAQTLDLRQRILEQETRSILLRDGVAALDASKLAAGAAR